MLFFPLFVCGFFCVSEQKQLNRISTINAINKIIVKCKTWKKLPLKYQGRKTTQEYETQLNFLFPLFLGSHFEQFDKTLQDDLASSRVTDTFTTAGFQT